MRVLSVSQINFFIKSLIEGDGRMRDIYARGEISNFTDHYRSGHLYFSLKDEKSVLKAVMFSSAARRLRFCPKEGMRVIVRGRVAVYEPGGQYQFYVEEMQPDGVGADAVTAVPGGKKPFLGMNTKGLLIAAGCIVVTAVLVIVLLCSFFGSSSKSVVKDYYKAIENCDAKDLMATVPKDYLKELMDDNDLSRKELTNDVQDYLDKYYDEYDDIKVTFEDKEKLDKNDFADYFDFEDASDLEVKKGVKYELKVRYRSDEKKDNESEDFIVFQYKGKWYSMDAMFLVAMATYF